MRLFLPALLALASAPCAFLFADDKADKSLGRSAHQRFNPTVEEQQSLVFDPRSGAVGKGRSFQTSGVRTKEFHFNQQYTPAKFETGDFQTKKSRFGGFKFGTKAADTRTKTVIPNVNAEAPTKTALTKEARDSKKTAAVRDLPDGDRTYLGPERKKLDNAVDPNKPLPGWTGDKMDILTLEQIRELLNKNK